MRKITIKNETFSFEIKGFKNRFNLIRMALFHERFGVSSGEAICSERFIRKFKYRLKHHGKKKK